MIAVTENLAGYDPFSPAVMADPLPFYARLRSETPVLFLEKYDSFVFSRFQDIVDVMTLPGNAFIASESTLPTVETLLRHNQGAVQEVPMDPVPPGPLLGSPHFELLRTAHIKPFRPSHVRSMATFIQQLCDERLDALLPLEYFDLTLDYGGNVAASVICHLFGMPLAQADDVLRLVNDLSRTDKEGGASDVPTIIGTCVAMMIDVIARRRKEGADGSNLLIDGLIQLDGYGRSLSDVEVATQLVCAFVGGTETVPKIAAHGLMELARYPAQLAEVRSDLATNVPLAVEEMIRFCAPAQWFARTAHRDVTVAGVDIRKGQRVIALFGSAARDEAEFDEPDRFIWNRKIERVLSFGAGPHYCIGIHLARLELRILVETFLRRVDSFAFDMERAVRLPSSFQWGWNRLPIIVERKVEGV
jgi:cytochrome P450